MSIRCKFPSTKSYIVKTDNINISVIRLRYMAIFSYYLRLRM